MANIGLRVETEVEDAGRWIAEVVDMPGVTAYGATEKEAIDSARVGVAGHRREESASWRTRL